MNSIAILVSTIVISIYLALCMQRSWFVEDTILTWQESQKKLYRKEGIIFYALALFKSGKLKDSQKIEWQGVQATVNVLCEQDDLIKFSADIVIGKTAEHASCTLKKIDQRFLIVGWA